MGIKAVVESAFRGRSATSYGTQHSSLGKNQRQACCSSIFFFIFTFYCPPSYMPPES